MKEIKALETPVPSPFFPVLRVTPALLRCLVVAALALNGFFFVRPYVDYFEITRMAEILASFLTGTQSMIMLSVMICIGSLVLFDKFLSRKFQAN